MRWSGRQEHSSVGFRVVGRIGGLQSNGSNRSAAKAHHDKIPNHHIKPTSLNFTHYRRSPHIHYRERVFDEGGGVLKIIKLNY